MPNDPMLEIGRLRAALLAARGRLLMLDPKSNIDDIDQVILDSVLADNEMENVNALAGDRVTTREEEVDAAAVAATSDEGAQSQRPPLALGAQDWQDASDEVQAAANWRALTRCARIRAVGWINDRDTGRLLHLELELWTRHPESGGNAPGILKLADFVDAVRLEDRDCSGIAQAWRAKAQKSALTRPIPTPEQDQIS